ncbi:MAG: hypothetical protein KBE23_06655 [Chloroflexi bacterium]|nr:hypothetical protein [Chloroflexota bacterium]MBP7042406.1 hypothetical protein [Chloroflexota bacterium]
MIDVNGLLQGTAVDVPAHIQRLFALANEALELEAWLEDFPPFDKRADQVWERACLRTARRIDALDAALQAHNDEEILTLCGS